jgi:hypothetical protein
MPGTERILFGGSMHTSIGGSIQLSEHGEALQKSSRSRKDNQGSTQFGPSPARARGRMAALIVVIVLLTGVPRLYAQGRTATTSLALQVRPEELLQDQNRSVVLKIRLARGTTARFWAANSCASPSPQWHVIAMSGTYSIPYSALTPVSSSPSPSTMQVCLVSSDGMLNDSLPVGILGTGNGAAMQGSTPLIAPSGISVEVPAGWMVTARSGITTWSNP